MCIIIIVKDNTTLKEKRYKMSKSIILKSIEVIDNFEAVNGKDNKRVTLAKTLVNKNVVRYNNGEAVDSGLYGKVTELLSHDEKSTIYRVQAQGKNDAYIIVDGKRRPLEVKTNGGRIESLYKLSTKARESRYISYTLDVTIKAGKPRKDGTCKPAEHRYINALMTIAQFIELVESVNATKVIGHNDSDREVAIQSDSKKLYKALVNGEYMEYYRDWEYFTEDFK